MTTPVRLAVGDTAVMPLSVGGYGACQVTGIGKGLITARALAWESAEPPTLAQLSEAPPLILDHHGGRGEPAHINIIGSDPPPPGWVWLGRLPVPAAFSGPSDSFSGWSWLTIQIAEQRRWDRQLPAAAKRAYLAAATRGQIEVDFGAGPVTLGAATGTLNLTATAGPVRWSALDQLPRCTSLRWSGPDRGLVAALAEHPIIADLTWTDAPADLDLRGTGLTSLAVDGSIDTLRLPDGLRLLHLMDGARVAAISAAADARWLTLTITNPEPGAPLPTGLDRLQTLHWVGKGSIDAAALSGLAELESLWLSWHDAPGELTGLATLGELPRLAHLTLTNAYGIDAGTLPGLPQLTALTIHGLRRTAATAIRARYRRTAVHLTVTGAKNDTWLAANLTNPLRDWADDDPRGGAAACKAYAVAVRSIDALPADAPDRTGAAEKILRTFVEQLNHIDERYELIDTVRREEAGEAFAELATRAGIPTEHADDWFDQWRDF